MKKKTTNNKAVGRQASQPVHIEFNHATASAISIAGTFNDWRPAVTPMVSLGDGRWSKELILPPRGFMNTGWWWTACGCRIRAPSKPFPTRLAE